MQSTGRASGQAMRPTARRWTGAGQKQGVAVEREALDMAALLTLLKSRVYAEQERPEQVAERLMPTLEGRVARETLVALIVRGAAAYLHDALHGERGITYAAAEKQMRIVLKLSGGEALEPTRITLTVLEGVRYEGADGCMKVLMKFTRDDGLHVVETFRARISGLSKKARWFKRMVELLDEHDAATVGDLPEPARRELAKKWPGARAILGSSDE